MCHNPVCVKCQCELRPEKNEVGLLDMFNPSDKEEPQPYQIWDADLWKCPKCGLEVVTGFGINPIAEHYQENGETLKRAIKNYQKYSQLIKNYPI